MIINGYDTDDLTQRQNHYFHKLKKVAPVAASLFLAYCVRKNISIGMFDSYPGDCEWLLRQKSELLTKCGIDVTKIYD